MVRSFPTRPHSVPSCFLVRRLVLVDVAVESCQHTERLPDSVAGRRSHRMPPHCIHRCEIGPFLFIRGGLIQITDREALLVKVHGAQQKLNEQD